MKALAIFFFEKIRIERILGWGYRWMYQYIFQSFGRGATVSPFIQAIGLDCVSIGRKSRISRNSRILALKRYRDQKFTPELIIGDNVSIGFGCTLSCVNRIYIGNDVTIGDNVYIADSNHEYKCTQIGVLEQPLLLGQVSIGAGAWIGYGTFLAGNISIGEHSVVGANSVVTHNVPPYTVVAGAPAHPLKFFDHKNQTWLRVGESDSA